MDTAIGESVKKFFGFGKVQNETHYEAQSELHSFSCYLVCAYFVVKMLIPVCSILLFYLKSKRDTFL